MSETKEKSDLFNLDKDQAEQLDNLNLDRQTAEKKSSKGDTFVGMVGKEIYNVDATNLVVENEDKTSKMTITNKVKGKPVVRIEGPIFDFMAEKFVAELAKDKKSNLTIYLSSPGGSVAAGTQMFDAMMLHEGHIKTVATGHVASMGAVLFLGGDEKVITSGSELMYHEVRPTAKQLDGLKKLVADANSALNRIIKNRTNLTQDQVDSFFDGTDVWINAKEAVEMGIADSMLDVTPEKQPKTSRNSADEVIGSGLESLLTLTNQYFPISNKEYSMEFLTWLESKVDDVAALTEAQKAEWKVVYDAQVAAGTINNPAPSNRAAQIRRELEIEKLCGEHRELAAEAIENKWDDEMIKMKVEIADLKKKQTVPSESESFNWFQGTIHVPSNQVETKEELADAMTAAVALQLDAINYENLTNPYGKLSGKELLNVRKAMNVKPISEKSIEYGIKNFSGTVQEFASFCAWEAGKQANPFAFDPFSTVENSFSSLTFPARFKDVIERAILAGFQMVEPKWAQLAYPVTVTDFKKHYKYRMYGTGRWERKTSSGELTHGEVQVDEAHFNQADTFGQVLNINREVIVNNDIGSINDVSNRFAMMGRMAPEWGVWDFVVENLIGSTAFTFTYQNLRTMYECFCRKGQFELNGVEKDKADNFQIAIELQRPTLLLSRCDMVKITEIVNGGAVLAGDQTVTEYEIRTIMNALTNMFNLVDSSYMPEGYVCLIPAPSPTGSVIELAFLNGRQLPTIEQTQLPSQKLGFGLRGWIDFGVNATSNDFSCNQDDVDAYLATQVSHVEVNEAIAAHNANNEENG